MMNEPTAIRVTPQQIEEFLVREAAILDEWRLDEWISLFEDGARYLIPALDRPDGQPETSLFLVSDDWPRLQSRVKQLLGKAVWAENPRSTTCRMVSNFRVVAQDGEEIRAAANFAIWRTQNDQTHAFVGRYAHILIHDAEHGLRFRERKAILNMNALRPHGKVSFII